jgi:hypothetical protein
MGAWNVAQRKSFSILMGAAILVAILAPFAGAASASAASLPGQVITVDAATSQ